MSLLCCAMYLSFTVLKHTPELPLSLDVVLWDEAYLHL